jgi:RNA polymerase sigma factor (sigma-70 family)
MGLVSRDIAAEIERLYAARYESFCRMASTVTGDAEAARDAVQEGFAKALASRDEFRGEGSLEGWVWHIVLRVSLDSRRNGHRSGFVLGAGDLAEELWAPELPHPERDPELADALRHLTERQRLILFLRYFADLTHADIAALMDIRLGTVSATLNQAKTSLAQRLDQARLVTTRKETLK